MLFRSETVELTPAHTVSHTIPAEYRTVAENVQVAPAHREWRVVRRDGEAIGCWVEIPALYTPRTRQVLAREAQTVDETIPATYGTRLREEVVEPAHEVATEIPAVYETRERAVIVEPAHEVEETIPAVYGTRMVEEVVEPAHTVAETIPAEYGVREHQELVSPPTRHWAPAPGEGACERRASY